MKKKKIILIKQQVLQAAMLLVGFTTAISLSYGQGISFSDRIPTKFDAGVKAGYLEFTWNRGLSDTIFDWRSSLKMDAKLEDTERIRWQFQLSPSGTFSGEQTSHLIPSVSDARSWVNYPEGTNPLDTPFAQNPRETALVRMFNNGTRYGRVRLIMLGSNGTIIDSSAWSNTVSATYNTAIEPSWMSKNTDDGSSGIPTLNGVRILLGSLEGGSYEGNKAELQLGMNLNGVCVNDSWWKGIRTLQDSAIAGMLAKYPGKYGWFHRACWGANKVMTSDATSIEWWALQGGRLYMPQNYPFAIVGGGTSPGMLNPIQSWSHSNLLPSGTQRTRMLSITNDIDALDNSGVNLMYFSLYGAAHIIVDGTENPTNEQILKAHGINRVVSNNRIAVIDVLCTAGITDRELAPGTKTPEALVADALQASGRRFFGERASRTPGDDWAGTYNQLGDVASLDLLLNDIGLTGYSDARAAAPHGTRVNMKQYLKNTEKDPDNQPASYQLVMILNTKACSYIAAGTTNSDKMVNALQIAADLWYTWKGKVIPIISPHSMWKYIPQADMDEFFSYTDSLITGIDSWADKMPHLNIYPNPSQGVLNIQSEKKGIEEVKFFNLLGENVLNILNPGETMYISQLSAGVYTVGLKASNQHWVYKKLIIE